MILRSVKWLGAIIALIVSLVSANLAMGQHDFEDFRGLWVTRFDYRNGNAASVQNIVDNAASMGITDLMFQVRGQSDAYYNSQYEPRSQFLSGSWDPLQVAIDRAHSHGMKLHAWINTMPLWTGTTPPSTTTPIPAPFYHENPSYRVHDLNGNPQPLQNSYVIANPILPEWHNHVSNVTSDIVGNYNVDGVHLDYVRWLGDTSWASLPHDAQSHQLFTAATGLPATSSNANSYRQFIRDRITSLVTQVGNTIDVVNPAADLSAAVWRDPDVGSSQVLQEYRTWMEQDLVDTIIPMMYLSPSNNNLLVPNLTNVMSINTNTRVAPGVGVYLHDDPNFTVSQLQTMYNYGTGGVTLYAYDSFFGSGQLGADRQTAVADFFNSLGGNSGNNELVSITDFEVDEGYFATSPTFSGSNTGIISATADRVLGDALAGVGSQEISVNGNNNGWFLRHLAGIGNIADPSGNLMLDSTGHLGVWLKTTDPGVSVRLAIDDPGTADRGIEKSLIADGKWHLYEWDLDDNSQWEGWVTGDGLVTGNQVSLDSIQFFGNGAATIYMDEVSQNPGGSIWDLFIHGDFDEDGDFDCADVDQLVLEMISGNDQVRFDLNADGVVDGGDLTRWLADAGEANLSSGNSFLVGDADLNGVVDASDYNAWNANKFSANGGYCGGDFDGSGFVDITDFNSWNQNKFTSAGSVALVPEPSSAGILVMLCGWGVLALRRNRGTK